MAALAIPLAVGLGSSAVFGAGTFLGVSAFGWGWAIGSMAASYLLAPDQEGPRLSDLSAGGSEYGTPIPLCYGTTKVAGNVIWASDLIETEHTESAKGGPEIETYTCSQHVQVLVCAGEVTGIRKIWANGRLIYDISETNTSASGYSGNIRVYTGSETQVADSLIEAYKGAGNVPAHRGYCHVVFENLQLEDYGNRTPNFECEVVADGALAYNEVITLSDVAVSGYQRPVVLHGNWVAYGHYASTVKLRVYDTASNSLVIESDSGLPHYSSLQPIYVGTVNQVWIVTAPYVYKFDADTGAFIERVSPSGFGNYSAASVWDGGWVVAVVTGITNGSMTFMDSADASIIVTRSSPQAISAMVNPKSDGTIWTDGGADYTTDLQVWSTTTHSKIADVRSPVAIRSGVYAGGALLADPTRNRVIWYEGTTVAYFDADTLDAGSATITGMPPLTTSVSYLGYNPHTDRLYGFTSYSSDHYLLIIDPDTFVVEEYVQRGLDVGQRYAGYWATANMPLDYIYSYGSDSLGDGGLFKIPISPRLAANQVALSSIVTDLCERAGLAAADIDVADLTDMVDGYKTT